MTSTRKPAPAPGARPDRVTSIERAPSGTAGVDLRLLRQRAGVSQRVLAQRCGLTDRTIRGLETGAIRKPQRETLLRLAAALGLDAPTRRSFLIAWRDQGTRLTLADTYLFGRPPPAEVDRILRRQSVSTRWVSRDATVTVSANRRIVASEWSSSMVITEGEFDEWLVGFKTDDDVPAPRVVGANGCVCTRSWELDDGSHLFALDLRRTLRTGDTYVLRYRVEDGTAELPMATSHEDGCLATMQETGASLSMEVRFDPRMLPEAIYRADAVRHGASYERGKLVELAQDHSAYLVLDRTPPGVHGLLWSWPDGEQTQTGTR